MSQTNEKPLLAVLATGGTIAGWQEDRRRPGYRSGEASVEALVEVVPELGDAARLEVRTVAAVGSQNISTAVMLKLLRMLSAELARPEVAGAIVTHGTDTMEETAYFLNLTLGSDKPVTMVGAMRPATSLSADGPMNLYNAAIVAASPDSKGRGVLVVMNDEIHYAAEVTKTDTTNPNSMASPNRGRAGVCDTGATDFFSRTDRRHTVNSALHLADDVDALPDVAIVYAHAGMTDAPVRGMLGTGVRGIVLAGVGDGNTSDDALAALSEAAAGGIVVVRSSHVGHGIVRRNIEVNDDALGFVAARALNPQKARILLQLALLKTTDTAEIQRMFEQY